MNYYIGLDIGGTNLKAGVVDETGNILSESDIPTGADRPQEVVLQDIISAITGAIAASAVSKNNILAVGVGSPGMVDSETGTVIYNNNLGWHDFKIGDLLGKALNLPVRVENDANAAALGEVIAGSAKGVSSAMIITLGTGVGSGFVIDGKIWTGFNSMACEFGHMVIEKGGRLCNCGRRGCFEAYASASGLIAMTKDAIAKNPDGKLAELAKKEGHVSGHTAFDAKDMGDEAAAKLIDNYIDYLACGLVSLINGLQPEVISIGGGIGKQGERLLVPLRKRIDEEVYGAGHDVNVKKTKIVSCTLGYKAGLIGAAMAAKQLANK